MINLNDYQFLYDMYDINLHMVDLIESKYETDDEQLASPEWQRWMRIVNHLGVVF